MDQVGFGLGCLVCVPRLLDEDGDVPDRRTAPSRWWEEQIASGLGLLPSITDLNVEISGLKRKMPQPGDFLLSKESYDIDYDYGPTEGSSVEFTLTIPTRMQAEVTPWFEGSTLDTERFAVRTTYGNAGPVTFVRSAATSESHKRSSRMVVVVREFLEREFERLTAPIELVTVGPSPFWANFTLTPKAVDDDEDLDLLWEKMVRGYDHVHLYYDSGRQSLDTAYGEVLESLRDSFSLYYNIIRGRNRRLERAEDIADAAGQLIDMHRASGLLGWAKKTFKSGTLARDLLVNAMSAKQIEAEELHDASETLTRYSQFRQLEPLREMLEEEAGVAYTNRLETSIEIARLLEGGRLKQYEVAVVAAATALGGSAGAIAALLVS